MFERIEINDGEKLYAYTYADEETANNGGEWLEITELPIETDMETTALNYGFQLSDKGWVKYLTN
jgi:hypothetical protein